MNLKKIFQPKSLAVVGGYWADFVDQGNRALGFKGPIWHINPKRSKNNKNKFYSNVSELPDVPDCVYLAVSRDLTVKIIKDFAEIGTGGAVCLASRFSETNSKIGKLKTKQLQINAANMPFLGPNCYGFINYLDSVAVWSDQIAGDSVKKGIGLICQSGTIGNTISFNQRSLPIGYVMSLGNQTNITIEDSIEYLLNDKRVTAIGIYAESFNKPSLLIKVFEKAKNKNIPIAIVKVGRSKIASKTILSHTGSLSGKEDIFDTLFESFGIARCDTLSELCETLKIFHTFGALKENKISIMGPSGGDMAMTGDISDDLSINYSPIPKNIVKELKKVSHKGVIISNPFDLQTYNWNDPLSLKKTFDLMFKSNFQLVALMLDFPNMNKCDIDEWEIIIDKFILSAKLKNTFGALISSLPETLPKHIREKCLKAGIVPLQGLKESLKAINFSILTRKAWLKNNKIKIYKDLPIKKNLHKSYSEYESKKILKRYGINIPQSILTNTKNAIQDSKKIKFPLVMKINSTEISHKSEVKGVFTNILSLSDVKKYAKHLGKISYEILIEKMVSDTVAELIIGIKIDSQFGPVIVIGAGGIYTELFRDTQTLLTPINKNQIKCAINKLKISKIIKGYRGKNKGDMEEIVNTIMKLSKFAEKNAHKIIEVDINPLIVREKGKGVIAVDAMIHYSTKIK